MGTQEDGDRTRHSQLENIREGSDQKKKEGWSYIYKTFQPKLVAWSRWYGLNAEEIEDLVSQILVLLVVRIGQYKKSKGKFRSWLWKMHRNQANRFMRKKGKTPRTNQDLPDVSGDDRVDGDDNGLDWEALKPFLEQLAARCHQEYGARWEGVLAVILDGKGVAEVAQRLGMTPGAFAVWKHRLLRKLQAELQGHLPPEYFRAPEAEP